MEDEQSRSSKQQSKPPTLDEIELACALGYVVVLELFREPYAVTVRPLEHGQRTFDEWVGKRQCDGPGIIKAYANCAKPDFMRLQEGAYGHTCMCPKCFSEWTGIQ